MIAIQSDKAKKISKNARWDSTAHRWLLIYKKDVVLLFVRTRTLLALRERNPFFAFVWSSTFGVLLVVPVSFRQILELEACARLDGADAEGGGAGVSLSVGRLEGLDGTDGLGIELGHRCESE